MSAGTHRISQAGKSIDTEGQT